MLWLCVALYFILDVFLTRALQQGRFLLARTVILAVNCCRTLPKPLKLLRTNTAVLYLMRISKIFQNKLVFFRCCSTVAFSTRTSHTHRPGACTDSFLGTIEPPRKSLGSRRTLIVGRDCFNLNSEIIWLLKVTLGRRWRKHSANWGLFSDGRLRSPGRGEASRN